MALFDYVDEDGSGEIDRDEFVAGIEKFCGVSERNLI